MRKPADEVEALTAVSIAKRQWERTFDAISDPLMIVDDQYVIRRANLALADDLGVAVQRVVGRCCHEVRGQASHAFPRGEGGPCAGCPVEQARRERAPRDGELQAPSGRVYRLRAYPIDADGDEGSSSPMVVCSYRDVTEERETLRQLGNAEKVAAIGRLAGGVAHEINNPLGGILAFAQILLRERCPAEEQQEYLREIEKSAFRCKAIVEALLRFSRQSAPLVPGPMALNNLVRATMAVIGARYASPAVQAECVLADDLPAVLGNPQQIQQVLVNLLSNAFDAIAAGDGSGSGLVQVRTVLLDGFVELQVADSGTGISEEHLSRIFDPFFTTKGEGQGSGLGLALTYAIVSEHGGRIGARNRPEGGAVFTVALPVAPPA
jgi:two-component system NtrC family sensor kinase